MFVAGEGYSRKVDFEEFGVTLAIDGGVEGGVNVVKDVFWWRGHIQQEPKGVVGSDRFPGGGGGGDAVAFGATGGGGGGRSVTFRAAGGGGGEGEGGDGEGEGEKAREAEAKVRVAWAVMEVGLAEEAREVVAVSADSRYV